MGGHQMPEGRLGMFSPHIWFLHRLRVTMEIVAALGEVTWAP